MLGDRLMILVQVWARYLPLYMVSLPPDYLAQAILWQPEQQVSFDSMTLCSASLEIGLVNG